MKKFFFAISGLFLLAACADQSGNDNASAGNDAAKVDKIRGKYVYIHSMPTHNFTRVSDSRLDLISGVVDAGNGQKGLKKLFNQVGAALENFDFNNRLNQMIEQLESNSVDFDGVVFPNDLKEGYAIKFNN